MTDPIVQIGDPVLREEAKEVPKEMFGTAALQEIVEKMKHALAAERYGAAIAAPQIGIGLRIFVVAGSVVAGKKRDKKTGKIHAQEGGEDELLTPELVCINPVITKLSRKKEDMEEGCLSVRGKYGMVPRSLRATIRAFDERGVPFERGAADLLAHAFQHEVDHLNGILFIDRARDVWEHVEKEDTPEKTA